MKITIEHAASSYGMPVAIDDAGRLMDYAPAVRMARSRLKMSVDQLGAKLGVSARTVQGWEGGRMPTAQALNMLGKLLS
jgi:DNA-binding transcriptional regulator YiaG